MPTTEAIIALEVDGRPARKVLRIIASRDGSFAIAVPFYPALPGEIAKVAAPTIINPDHSAWMTPIDRQRVDVPVKMMFHASGFVQFSSFGRDAVRSGRRKFFVPKGMGIHSHPILSPIETGPTFMVGTNALHRFEAVDGSEKIPLIRFTEADVFDRDDHIPDWRHLYQVEGFVLPAPALREARLENGELTLVKEYAPARPEWQVRFRMFLLPTPIASIGFVVTRQHIETTDMLEGYSINGPRDLGSGRWLHGTWWERSPEDDARMASLPSLAYDTSL
jgi:hypothetical protein